MILLLLIAKRNTLSIRRNHITNIRTLSRRNAMRKIISKRAAFIAREFSEIHFEIMWVADVFKGNRLVGCVGRQESWRNRNIIACR